MLVAPGLIMAPVAAWALSQDAFSNYAEPLASRESVGGEFGLLLLAMIAVLFVAGFAVNLGLSRVTPTVDMKRRAGIAAVAVACAVPLALFTSVAFSDRGIGGTISDRVDELTSETTDAPSEGAGRLAATSNSRSTFWREAGDVYEDGKRLAPAPARSASPACATGRASRCPGTRTGSFPRRSPTSGWWAWRCRCSCWAPGWWPWRAPRSSTRAGSAAASRPSAATGRRTGWRS